jgi:hypothetical protein
MKHKYKSFDMHLVKITNNLIEQANAFNAVFTDCVLLTKVREVWYWCKHDTYIVVSLMVKILQHKRIPSRMRQAIYQTTFRWENKAADKVDP